MLNWSTSTSTAGFAMVAAELGPGGCTEWSIHLFSSDVEFFIWNLVTLSDRSMLVDFVPGDK